jgi:hypothetical protein
MFFVLGLQLNQAQTQKHGPIERICHAQSLILGSCEAMSAGSRHEGDSKGVTGANDVPKFKCANDGCNKPGVHHAWMGLNSEVLLCVLM